MPLRRPLIAGVLALTATLASGCGGVDASKAPTTATAVDFCLTWTKVATYASDLVAEKVREGEMPTGEEIAEVITTWNADLLEVGTPRDMPDEARAAFEAWLEEDVDPDDLDPEDFEEDVDVLADWAELSGEEFTNTRSFNTYLTDTCSALWRERGLL